MASVVAILVAGLLASISDLCDGISSEDEYPLPKQRIMPGFHPHFAETFNDPDDFSKNWVKSEAKKDGFDGDLARYDGDWEVDYPRKLPIDGDMGLVFKQKAKHRAISSKLDKPFVFTDKPLYLQYEVLFQDTQECGGAYLKLLSEGPESADLKNFHDKTPYTIMFGPDKCGNIHHLHFIFRHKNPINGSFEEKHSKGPSKRIDELFTDGVSHLYTLVILPDNTYQILVDHEVTVKGSLLEDFNPPVNPPAEIDDPNDHKPEDWDEREKIPDETATKPDDWDESAPPMIPDPNAVKPDNWLESEPVDITDPSAEKPDDWDDTMDGEWEAPMVPNPACEDAAGCGPWSPPMIDNPAFKGKWAPPLIDNPKYKGKWQPKKIPNPDFFEDKNPFKMTTITALGLELWSMTANIMFDNFVITDNEEYLRKWTAATYDKKMEINNKNADSLWTRIMVQINYKPGWWALYFLYCSIPIGGYVYYLYRRVKEEGTLMSKFFQMTNAYPWLWILVTLLPLIPIILIAYYCLRAPQEQEEAQVPLLGHGDHEGQGDQEGHVNQEGLGEQEEQTDQPDQHDQERRSADGSQYGDDDEEREGGGGDARARTDELENERNESMDGSVTSTATYVTQRSTEGSENWPQDDHFLPFSPEPSTSTSFREMRSDPDLTVYDSSMCDETNLSVTSMATYVTQRSTEGSENWPQDDHFLPFSTEPSTSTSFREMRSDPDLTVYDSSMCDETNLSGIRSKTITVEEPSSERLMRPSVEDWKECSASTRSDQSVETAGSGISSKTYTVEKPAFERWMGPSAEDWREGSPSTRSDQSVETAGSGISSKTYTIEKPTPERLMRPSVEDWRECSASTRSRQSFHTPGTGISAKTYTIEKPTFERWMRASAEYWHECSASPSSDQSFETAGSGISSKTYTVEKPAFERWMGPSAVDWREGSPSTRSDQSVETAGSGISSKTYTIEKPTPERLMRPSVEDWRECSASTRSRQSFHTPGSGISSKTYTVEKPAFERWIGPSAEDWREGSPSTRSDQSVETPGSGVSSKTYTIEKPTSERLMRPSVEEWEKVEEGSPSTSSDLSVETSGSGISSKTYTIEKPTPERLMRPSVEDWRECSASTRSRQSFHTPGTGISAKTYTIEKPTFERWMRASAEYWQECSASPSSDQSFETPGVRQRWSTMPSTSSEQQNLVNEQLDNENDESVTSEAPKKESRPKAD